MKKIYYIIILSISILVLGLFVVLRINNNKEVLSFETTKIEKGDISTVITATGSVEAITTVDVGTQVSGIIQNIYVDFNSVVKCGQTIAILDTTMLHSSLISAKADVDQKSANLEFYKKSFERVKLLFDSNSVSESDYDQAKWNYETAKANYVVAKASLDRAKINLSYATIVSPINGVIVSRAVDVGQTVAASFSTPTLFSIAQDLTKMQVMATIDEADIGQVKEGNKVVFSVDAYPDEEFKGNVQQIRLEPTITQNVVTYSVLINAPNPDLKLMPGMTANLSIMVAEENNIYKLSNKALRYTPSQDVLRKDMKKIMEKTRGDNMTQRPAFGSQMPSENAQKILTQDLKDDEALIWIKSDDIIKPRKINIGLSDGTYTVVKNELSEDEEIITGETKQKKKEQQAQQSPFMPGRPGRK